VDNEIDYTKHTEPELVDMFGCLDPRFAQAECTRLARFLTDRGYIVTDGITGPGSAEYSTDARTNEMQRTEMIDREVKECASQ
jgi:hypothetical protein